MMSKPSSETMEKINFFFEKIEKEISRQAFALDRDCLPKELYEPISYTLNLGGKRMRPLLVMLGCDLFGGDTDKALSPAIGMEIFHNFTLIHDDIMDDAPLRRGKMTVHKKWGTNVAILSGDAMFIKAYQSIIKVETSLLPEILNCFNETALKVCEGQQSDMQFENRDDVSEAEYIEMIGNKTAVLPACALKIGALMAGADADDCKRIFQFGKNIGIAFQLRDDILDVFGEGEKTGKQIGGDIIANKKTYLLIKAFEKAEGKSLKKLHWLIHSENPDSQVKVSGVSEIFNQLGIKNLAIEKMNYFHKKAMENLNEIKVEDKAKQPLLAFARNLMERDS